MDVKLSLLLCIIIGTCAAQVFQSRFQYSSEEEKSIRVSDDTKHSCTHVDDKNNATLRGGVHAGRFTKHGGIHDMHDCIAECCQDGACDVAFMPGRTCYTVKCLSEQSCESIPTGSSHLVKGGVQVAHVSRTTRNGNSKDVVVKRSKQKQSASHNQCLFSRVAYNQTIVGGQQQGDIIDLGNIVDVRHCAEQCCSHDNCDVAVVRDSKCYAIECLSKSFCDSRDAPSTNGNTHMLVYINKRNGERPLRNVACQGECIGGICTNKDACLCDVGLRGDQCDEQETEGRCDPLCGEHGTCNYNDTCLCDSGWEGYKCDRQIKCQPPCLHGRCANSYPPYCSCQLGWTGVRCDKSNGDKAVLASTGEQVLFTKSEIEPELAIKVPEKSPPSRGSDPVSALTVAICCGLATVVLLSIAMFSITQQIIAKRAVLRRGVNKCSDKK